jgi:DNA-binding NtrC family response regulator
VALNCAAVPEQLLENELFGHERGAFTGAEGRYCGIFEQAAGGTLFLDEISDLPLSLQGKLLRVLQEREIRRLGGTEVIPVDVRLVAAASEPLEKAIQTGRFREDLFFRLNVVTIAMPSLREHPEDIRELAEHFLALYTPAGESPPALDTLALAKLQGHTWPGNIRELENTLRRALVVARGSVILEQDIKLGSVASGPGSARPADLLPCACEEDALDRALRLWLTTCSAGTAVNDLEAKLLRATLCHTGGNQVQAARLLGISRSTLREWIKRHPAALPPEGFSARE